MYSNQRDSIKNDVREAADIVEVINEFVTLKKTGSRFVGLCPFHGEKTPSFSVNPQKQFFYCFGCGESGDVFSFMMKYNHMTFPEALKALADKYQIKLPEKEMSQQEKKRLKELEQLYQVHETAAKMYQASLAGSEGKQARQYLENRGVPTDFITRYRLGYAPSQEQRGWSYQTDYLQQYMPVDVVEKAGFAVKNNHGGYYDRFRSRIMFPISDMTGRVVAFGGRIIGDGKPKYMNSPESPIFEKSRILFGLHNHKEQIRASRRALIVEGNFDLLLLAVNGITNVVAPLGTSLTPQHVKSLRGYCSKAILLFDADVAGLNAAMRSIPYFLAEQLDCSVAILPEGHDPDSLIRKEGVNGIERQLENARPLAEFVFDKLVQEYGLTLGGKGKIINALQPIIKEAADPSQRNLMIAHFSEKLGVAPAQFGGVQKRPSPTYGNRDAGNRITTAVSRREKQILDFLIRFPEYLDEMLGAGLDSILTNDFARSIIGILTALGKQGKKNPEDVLGELSTEEEKKYVARLLMEEAEDSSWGDERIIRGMKQEILIWLDQIASKNEGALIQKQIKDAEQRGDTDLLMNLLRKKLDTEKKRTLG
jgi:DNA primase